ncbi:MAG: bacteriocin family protein [Synergistaceae bacterium]|nr:bacteriocin family protein [Synergistaceae bacterium]
MDMFGRDLAPISDAALGEIDAQASRTLRANLAARRFVDVKGPYGWDYAGVSHGRLESLLKDGDVGYGVRVSAPVLETRVEFYLSAIELHNIDRGCADADLVAVERAAEAAAEFEDKAVFGGFEKASIKGLKGGSPNPEIEFSPLDASTFISGIIGATDRSKRAFSIGGPFALVGGDDLRSALNKLDGYRTILSIVKKYTDVDEFIYAPAAGASYLVSKRGGDFELALGGDFVVGYKERKGDALTFYIAESFTFRILEPRAYSPVKLK